MLRYLEAHKGGSSVSGDALLCWMSGERTRAPSLETGDWIASSEASFLHLQVVSGWFLGIFSAHSHSGLVDDLACAQDFLGNLHPDSRPDVLSFDA